jgi:hypothetical protein
VIVRIMTYERSTLVNDEKYIGLDVHQATISVAVMDAGGVVRLDRPNCSAGMRWPLSLHPFYGCAP